MLSTTESVSNPPIWDKCDVGRIRQGQGDKGRYMKEFFDAAPKFIGVTSFVVLLMTIVHEWGYFYVLGWHLQTIATTYDYLSNSFVWLPTIAGILVGAQGLEATMTVEGDRVRLDRLVLIIASAIPAIAILLYFLIGGQSSPALSISSLVGIATVFIITKLVSGKWVAKDRKHRFVLVAPLVVLLMLGYGITSGYSDLSKTSDIYTVNQKESQSTRPLVLLRSFEKGILVRDMPAGRIEFIRWENVNSLSRLLVTEKSVGYLCVWFNVVCHGSDPNPIIP
jgi:hypothetical protein